MGCTASAIAMGCAPSKGRNAKRAVPSKMFEPSEPSLRTMLEPTDRTSSVMSFNSVKFLPSKIVPTAMMIDAAGEVSSIARSDKPADEPSSPSWRDSSSERSRESEIDLSSDVESNVSSSSDDELDLRSLYSSASERSRVRVRCGRTSIGEALDQLEDEDFSISSGPEDPDICIVEMSYSGHGKRRHGRKFYGKHRRDKKQLVVYRRDGSGKKEAGTKKTAAIKEPEQKRLEKPPPAASASSRNPSSDRKSVSGGSSQKKTKDEAVVKAESKKRNSTTTGAAAAAPNNRRKRNSIGAVRRMSRRGSSRAANRRKSNPEVPLGSSLQLETMRGLSNRLLMFEDSANTFDLSSELFKVRPNENKLL